MKLYNLAHQQVLMMIPLKLSMFVTILSTQKAILGDIHGYI